MCCREGPDLQLLPRRHAIGHRHVEEACERSVMVSVTRGRRGRRARLRLRLRGLLHGLCLRCRLRLRLRRGLRLRLRGLLRCRGLRCGLRSQGRQQTAEWRSIQDPAGQKTPDCVPNGISVQTPIPVSQCGLRTATGAGQGTPLSYDDSAPHVALRARVPLCAWRGIEHRGLLARRLLGRRFGLGLGLLQIIRELVSREVLSTTREFRETREYLTHAGEIRCGANARRHEKMCELVQ